MQERTISANNLPLRIGGSLGTLEDRPPRRVSAGEVPPVIEMDIVSPPYLLDFGKCYLDRKVRLFPGGVVWQLEKFGIYHIDPRLGNVRFGEV